MMLEYDFVCYLSLQMNCGIQKEVGTILKQRLQQYNQLVNQIGEHAFKFKKRRTGKNPIP